MSDANLTAQARTEFGKGAARRVRRDGKIPAVLYGRGLDPVHLTLPGHATGQAVRIQNALLTLDIDGKEQLALVKEVQRDVLRPIIHHIDLVAVKKGEKVIVEVGVTVVGEASHDTFVDLDAMTLRVQAEATAIPESIEVSVEGLEAGTQILAGDVKLPAGVTLDDEPDLLVVNVTQAVSAEALEAELEGAEAEAGIEKDEPEAAAEEASE
ncbi:MAG: 50S ribosomal protein L25/general stress protein Ctc [Dermatophilus congolensis]|nr:50S ribosomal protein L25/general stress protein Ctc [Dermatophilus congolensis]